MNTREKEPAYQQPDPYYITVIDDVNQHSEQGAMYEAVNDPAANVNQNFDYEVPPSGDDATTGSHNHQQTATYVNARPSGPRHGKRK